jgi:ABC-2 type transport system permease protein
VTVWRLERLRLLRTLRGIGLLASFLAFGILMPIVTRYQDALFRHLGGGVQVIVPPPTPPQAIAAYLQNAMQIGLLVAVLIAAGSLAFDAKPEWAAFLRTRAPDVSRLVLPKVAILSAATAACYVAGLAAAWVGTVALIGSVPIATLAIGGAFGALYLVFAIAVVAAASGVARSVIGAGGLALVVLVLLPVLAQVPALEPWMPSALVGAPTAIASGEAAAGFLRASAVTIAGAVVLVWVAIRLLARREV